MRKSTGILGNLNVSLLLFPKQGIQFTMLCFVLTTDTKICQILTQSINFCYTYDNPMYKGWNKINKRNIGLLQR